MADMFGQEMGPATERPPRPMKAPELPLVVTRRLCSCDVHRADGSPPDDAGDPSYDNGFYDEYTDALNDIEGWIRDRGEEHAQVVLQQIARLRTGAGDIGD